MSDYLKGEDIQTKGIRASICSGPWDLPAGSTTELRKGTSMIVDKYEFRDYKYDFFVPINYNTKKPKIGKGSAIFIHLTRKYQPTLGCVALQKKDFLILIKLINRNTKIKLI